MPKKSAKQIVDEVFSDRDPEADAQALERYQGQNGKKDKEHVKDILNNLPIVSEPRCNICKSEFRPIIDRMIAGPYSYAAIARQFMGKDPHLRGNFDAVRKSVERHAKNHVNIQTAAIREIIEQRALDAGLLVNDVQNTYLTNEALLELYVKKGFDQVTKDDTWVRHQDILKAVEMIETMKRDTIGEQIEVLKKQVFCISQAVREIVPEDMHPQIIARVEELFTQPIIDLQPEKPKEITA